MSTFYPSIGVVIMKMMNTSCLVLATIAMIQLPAIAAESPYVYGIHDATPDPTPYLNHIIPTCGSGWVTATVAIGADPNDFSGQDFSSLANQGATVICRLNYGYYPTGTIPLPSQFANFATRCKNFVQASHGCSIWIIGNEVNLSAEWPFDGSRFNYISPQSYADCYRQCYNAIRSIRSTDKILPQPSAEFAGPYGNGFQDVNGTAYPCDGQPLNWVQYENQLLTACKNSGPVDGIALHIYSRGYSSAQVFSTQQVNAGGQNLYWSFYGYKDWINYGIPTNMWNLALYATECDGYYYWKGGHPEDPTQHYEAGWMQNIYNEINNYNHTAYQTGKPLFRCVNMYRWCSSCDGWNIDGASNPYEGQMLSDLDSAVSSKYTWKPNDATVRLISAPLSVMAGGSFSATVTMHNHGTSPWRSGGTTPHRLGSQSPQDNTMWGGFNRVELPSSPINPGADATFTFNCIAPSTAGNYPFAWKMVQEAVEWFGETASTSINVTNPAVIVDNSDAGFTTSTNWSTGTSATDKYGSNYRFRIVQAISDSATWNATIATSGNYNVYAWWSQGSNRSTNAPYIVYFGTSSQTVKVNQQTSGGTWNLLGTYALNAGANSVKLSCWTGDTNHVVIADAIKWVKQ